MYLYINTCPICVQAHENETCDTLYKNIYDENVYVFARVCLLRILITIAKIWLFSN
jgi:hypothetical protein